MNTFSHPVSSQPITLNNSDEAKVYGLFAIAMGLTVFGVFFGIQYAPQIITSGLHWLFLVVELAIILTARWWVEKTPLNYLLFGLFPVFSGFFVAPFILMVLTQYANGGVILMNALVATASTAGAAALFAKTTKWNLGVMGKALFFAVIGLIILGILQFFVPAMQSTGFELALSGVGIVVFALFTAYDVQRITKMQGTVSPFLLALSLYLDIFNLFLYIVRFMLIIYGDRR